MDIRVKILSNESNGDLAWDVYHYITEEAIPEDKVDIKYSTVFDPSKNKLIYSALIYIEKIKNG